VHCGLHKIRFTFDEFIVAVSSTATTAVRTTPAAAPLPTPTSEFRVIRQHARYLTDERVASSGSAPLIRATSGPAGSLVSWDPWSGWQF
jgi:hypothetical protein